MSSQWVPVGQAAAVHMHLPVPVSQMKLGGQSVLLPHRSTHWQVSESQYCSSGVQMPPQQSVRPQAWVV